jgi:AcrR family transcriptional regulator
MTKALATETNPRDKIVEAAEELFARRGYAGVGLSEIAESVGLGKSTLFHHFRSKAQLYAAVVERILAQIELALMRSLAAGGSPVVRLDRWLDTIVDFLGERPAHARLLLRSLFEDDELTGSLAEEKAANDTLARIVESVAALLREGMASGELRVASIPHTIQSLIGLIIYHFASGDFGNELLRRPVFSAAEVKRRKEEVKNLVHFGLLAPASGGGRTVEE